MATPVTGTVVKQPLVTLQYSCPPPHPFPAVTDPTPEEQYQIDEQRKQVERAEKDVRHAQEQAAPPEKKGFMSSALKLASSVAHNAQQQVDQITSVTEKRMREHMDSSDQQVFMTEFPQLAAAGDKLLCAYSGKAMHQGMKVPGTIFVSNRTLCFTSDLFKDTIALTDIVSLQPSVALKTFNDGPPYILPLPIPSVVPTCLQVFTGARAQIFQFVDVNIGVVPNSAATKLSSSVKGQPVERLYNFLDHAWRAVVLVPNPQMKYSAPLQW